MTYQIPLENVMWSTLFREMEENKEELNIIDYGISQATLDQVNHYPGFHIRILLEDTWIVSHTRG